MDPSLDSHNRGSNRKDMLMICASACYALRQNATQKEHLLASGWSKKKYKTESHPAASAAQSSEVDNYVNVDI